MSPEVTDMLEDTLGVLWLLALGECSGTDSWRHLCYTGWLMPFPRCNIWFLDSPFLTAFLYSAAWNKARQRCCSVVSQDLKRQPSSPVSIDVGRAALCILLALQNTSWARERAGRDHGGIWAQTFCLGELHVWAASFWKVCGHLGGISSIYTAQGRLVLFSRTEDWGLRFLSD